MSYACDPDDQEQCSQGEGTNDFLDWVVDNYGCDAHQLSTRELVEAQREFNRSMSK